MKYILLFVLCITIVSSYFMRTTKDVLSLQNSVIRKTSVSQYVPSVKLFGVNISGAEFGEKNLPGREYTDYLYPSTKNGYNGFSYFASKKLTLIRIPILWERLQPSAFGALSQNDLQGLQNMINDAQDNHQHVIIDLHNFGRYYDKPMTKESTLAFADFWSKLSIVFKDSPTIYGYELMNEPHDLDGGCGTLATLSQSAITAIRKKDKHIIFVPGYSWQSARDWQNQSNCLKDLTDPVNRLVFSAHQYFDNNFSGQTYDTSVCNDEWKGAKSIQPFLTWLQTNHLKGIFTEYGVNDDACWTKNLDTFLHTLENNNTIIGGTYWSAGPWWGDYPLSVEANNPQMTILQKYPSKNY